MPKMTVLDDMPIRMPKLTAPQRCVVCTYPYTGTDIFCEVCLQMVSASEQTRYRALHAAAPPDVGRRAVPGDTTALPADPPAPLGDTDAGPCEAIAPPSSPQESVPAVDDSQEPPASPDTPDALQEAVPVVSRTRPAPSFRGCKVCQHPDLASINAQLQAGESYVTVERYTATTAQKISDDTLRDHAQRCLGLTRQPRRPAPRTPAVPRCRLCAHPDRAAIDTALQGGVPLSVIARQYTGTAGTFHVDRLGRHRRECLGLPPLLHARERTTMTPQPRRTHVPMPAHPALPRPDHGAPLATAPFAAQVDAELRRLTEQHATLQAEIARLTAQCDALDAQRTALRAWQETQKAAL